MARTVRDVALGYSILSGPDGADGYAIHARACRARRWQVRRPDPACGLGVGFSLCTGRPPRLPPRSKLLRCTLADLGCEVEEVPLPVSRRSTRSG